MRFNAIEFLKVAVLLLPAAFVIWIFWGFGARDDSAVFCCLVLLSGLLAWAGWKLGWPIYVVGSVCTLIPFVLMVGFLIVSNTDLIFKDQGKPVFYFSYIAHNAPLLVAFMSLGSAWAYVFRRKA